MERMSASPFFSEGPKTIMGTEEQIHSLREMVQSLCQVANPLGKSIDLLKEDSETMMKEEQFWIKDQKQQQDRLEEEKRITEQMLQDESGHLTEVEDEINYQNSRIASLKKEILQNDEVIMKFLMTIATTSVDLKFS